MNQSVDRPVDRRGLVLAAVLALGMVVTRVGHFGEFDGPPDASWAVFFLGGLWLRDLRIFPAFFLLAWLADLLAFALGTPTNCYSIAYLALIPAYGALWFAGRQVAERGMTLARVLRFGFGGALATFVIANLGMFWWATPASAPTLATFVPAVAGYFPGYLLTLSVYVGAALAIEQAMRWGTSIRAS